MTSLMPSRRQAALVARAVIGRGRATSACARQPARPRRQPSSA